MRNGEMAKNNPALNSMFSTQGFWSLSLQIFGWQTLELSSQKP
jgi:hypothetical protein